MATLARTVYVRDPQRRRDIILRRGEEPAPEYAALVTNPDCWENGQVPDTGSGSKDAASVEGDATEKAPAKKTAAVKRAASKPARGRDAADEGSGGA
ncbi:hypothetical protein [Streptomyces sp. NPDC101249]|uniref:hypothetical protein n=1 Tax=Streptomyces sp. NPDC101249 TaxID=3366140 RepID=UPI0038104BE5